MIPFTYAESKLIRRIQKRPTPSIGDAGVLLLAGPPGAGKTTAAKQLAQSGTRAFLERPEDNPHLLGVLDGDASLGYRCQAWFVSQIEEFLLGAAPDLPLVIDQDPAATALIYGRALRSRGLLSEDESNLLVERLEVVERLLGRWTAYRGVLLDAPFETLRTRVLAREAGRPELFWLREIREEFLSLAPILRYEVLSTDSLASPQLAEALLKKHGPATGPAPDSTNG